MRTIRPATFEQPTTALTQLKAYEEAPAAPSAVNQYRSVTSFNGTALSVPLKISNDGLAAVAVAGVSVRQRIFSSGGSGLAAFHTGYSAVPPAATTATRSRCLTWARPGVGVFGDDTPRKDSFEDTRRSGVETVRVR